MFHEARKVLNLSVIGMERRLADARKCADVDGYRHGEKEYKARLVGKNGYRWDGVDQGALTQCRQALTPSGSKECARTPGLHRSLHCHKTCTHKV